MYTPEEVFTLVDQLAPGMGVDARTAKALIGAEQLHRDRTTGGYKVPAQFSPRASHAGAQGVGQVMPATLSALQQQGHLPKDFANDGSLKSQVMASLAAIREMAPRAGGDPLKLAALYNGGSRAGAAYGTPAFAQAPLETQNHVKKVQFMLDQLGENQSPAESARLGMPHTGAAAPASAGGAAGGAGNSSLPFNVPGFEHILALYRGANSAGDAATTALTGYQNEANAGLAQATAAVAEQAQAEKDAAAARIDTNAILTARRAALASQFGANDEQLASVRQQYVDLESQRQGLEQQVNAQMAVGFFDNPLQYLANLTTLPGLVNQHNALAQRSNDLQTEITRRQQNTQQQMQTTAANLTEQFAKEQMAGAEAAAAKATMELAKLRTDNAGTNAKNLMTVLGVESDRATRAIQLESMLRAQRSQDAEFQKLAKKEQQEVIEVDGINQMLSIVGGKLDPRLWKEMSAAQKYPLTQMVARGSFGNDLAESYATITGLGMYNRNKADPSVAALMDTVARELGPRVAKLQANPLEKRKGEDLQAAALKELEAEWKAALDKGVDRERAGAAGSSNPYRLDYNMAHLSGKYKGTFIGDALAARAATDLRDGANSITFRDLEDAATVAMNAKKLTPAQAALALSKFYQTEQLAKFDALGMARFSLPKPDSYTVTGVGSGNIFGGSVLVDAANPAALENYLFSRQATRERALRMPSLFNPSADVGNPMLR